MLIRLAKKVQGDDVDIIEYESEAAPVRGEFIHLLHSEQQMWVVDQIHHMVQVDRKDKAPYLEGLQVYVITLDEAIDRAK